MEFFEVVGKRYSYKARFDSKRQVREEDLVKIVEAGMAAPSASNGQSPEFVIVNDESIVRQIGKVADNVPLRTAPAFVAVLTKPRARQVLDIETECLVADLAAATENIILAATALGYCCGWLDSPFVDNDVRTKAEGILDIPDDRMLLLLVPIGYPAEPGPRRPKKMFAQRASWNRYTIQR